MAVKLMPECLEKILFNSFAFAFLTRLETLSIIFFYGFIWEQPALKLKGVSVPQSRISVPLSRFSIPPSRVSIPHQDLAPSNSKRIPGHFDKKVVGSPNGSDIPAEANPSLRRSDLFFVFIYVWQQNP